MRAQIALDAILAMLLMAYALQIFHGLLSDVYPEKGFTRHLCKSFAAAVAFIADYRDLNIVGLEASVPAEVNIYETNVTVKIGNVSCWWRRAT